MFYTATIFSQKNKETLTTSQWDGRDAKLQFGSPQVLPKDRLIP